MAWRGESNKTHRPGQATTLEPEQGMACATTRKTQTVAWQNIYIYIYIPVTAGNETQVNTIKAE